jgi:hypothetical protein
VARGTTVTYTLRAQTLQPLPQGATVVDDLSGLLGHATITTPATQLANEGLTLEPTTMTLTWTLPAVVTSVTASAVTTVQFQVAVAPDAPGGAALTTAASPQGGTCSAGDPCATTLTVADPTGSTGATTPAAPPAGPPAPVATPASPDSPASTVSTTTTTRTPPVGRPALAVTAPAATANADPPCTDAVSSNATVVAGFEIDGNLCVNTAGNSDWSTVGGQPVAQDGYLDSTAFTQGASESNWPWTSAQIAGTVNNGQAQEDIGNVYATSRTVNGSVYAIFGFQRRASGSGSFADRIELNQLPNRRVGTARTGSPVPNRTTGDLRLTFTQTGTSPIGITGAARWVSTGANTGAWISLPSLVGFNGAINSVPVTDLSGGTVPAFTFAEVAVNLTTLFRAADLCSDSYGTLNMRSSASETETGSLVDWDAPVSFDVPSTCASVQVDKSWIIDGTPYDNGHQPAGFGATLSLTGQTNP